MLSDSRSTINGNGKHGTNGHHAAGPRASQDGLPPHNRDAERSLNGAMIRDNAIIPEVLATGLKAEHFYNYADRLVFAAIIGLHQDGDGADIVTVPIRLKKEGASDDAGGPPYIAELWDDASCAANHVAKAKAILDTAGMRRLIHLGQELQKRGHDPTVAHDELVAELKNRVAEIGESMTGGAARFAPINLGDLIDQYPNLHAPVIDGLLRQGETMNIISLPKIGKSWLVSGLGLSVAMGRPWMGCDTTEGNVLIIDNELHKPTIAGRLRKIAEAYDCPGSVAKRLDVLSLRGRLQNLYTLERFFRSLQPDHYKLVIIDSWYRMFPPGIDENDNAAITELFNVLDTYAEHLKTSFALVHHASKGNQAGKGITDVGSGAGSQSRAADTHLVLRPHQEDDVVVMDAAVRSFPPVKPKCLRWSWPFFTVAEGLDPDLLLETTRKKRTAEPQGTPSESASAKRERAAATKLLTELDKLDRDHLGVVKSKLKAMCGFNTDKMEATETRLIQEGIIEYVPDFTAPMPGGGKKDATGIRRVQRLDRPD